VKYSTFASLVTTVFINHRNKASKSIESVIRTTDKLAKDVGLKNDLLHMAKYRIIFSFFNLEMKLI